MLRWSSQETQTPLDLAGIADPSVDPLIPGSRHLVDFVGAVVDGLGDVTAAREAVAGSVGEVGTIRAALVMGNFEMMNRVADGVGIPVGRSRMASEADLITTLGIDAIAH